MKGAKTHITRGIITVAIAAFLIVRIFGKEEPVVPAPDSVVMIQPSVMGNIGLTINLVGTIEPADIVYIYSEAGSDVTAVSVKTGDTVTAGQVLVETDTRQAAMSKNAMDTVKITWGDAVSTLNRMAPLHVSGFVSDKEFEGYQTTAEAKCLQYESARIGCETQAEFNYVTSPISGRAEQLNVELHDTVGPSMQMYVIVGEGGNNVTFYATERVKSNLNLDAPVTMTKEGNQYGGSVAEINNIAEVSVGLFEVGASADDQETMVPGTGVEIQIPSVSARNMMFIPNHCVCYRSGDAYVYTYDQAGGMIHEAPMGVGIFGSESISVLSGLALDDMVLTTWVSELRGGTRVTLDTGAGEDAGQTDETESPTTDASAAQQKEAAKWAQ